jgi:hypothetical protein
MDELPSVNGQEVAVPTLIGQAPTRFAIGGRIRAGIKVLTTAAAQETAAQAIDDAGVEAGKSRCGPPEDRARIPNMLK